VLALHRRRYPDACQKLSGKLAYGVVGRPQQRLRHRFLQLATVWPVGLGVAAEGLTLQGNRVDAGIIGSSLLAPFRTTFDIPNRRLYLQGDRRRPAWPISSGIFVELRDGKILLAAVLEQISVCELPLQEDDELITIDVEPAPRRPAPICDLLRTAPERRLLIQRGDEQLQVLYRRPWPLARVAAPAKGAVKDQR